VKFLSIWFCQTQIFISVWVIYNDKFNSYLILNLIIPSGMSCLIVVTFMVLTVFPSSVQSRPLHRRIIRSLTPCQRECDGTYELCLTVTKDWPEKVVCMKAKGLCNEQCKLEEIILSKKWKQEKGTRRYICPCF
jgi:hypothetical protein